MAKDMGKLKEALDAGIDEFAASGEVPDSDTRAASASDEGSADDKETPSESGAEEDAEGKETPSPEGEDEDSTEDESTDGDEAEGGEPKDLLEGMSESRRKALLKFAPGGKIETAEELQAAEAKLIDDYWRNHNRLAERETDKKEEAPPAPKAEEKAEEVPPAVKHYDDILQAIVTDANDADLNIKGWQQERAKVSTDIDAYRRRLRSGDADATERGLLDLIEQREAIDGHISGWQRKFARLSSDYKEKAARREEVRTLHEIKSRADRQEKEAEQHKQSQAQQEREQLLTAAGTHAITEVKVPKEEHTKFRSYLRFTIDEHFRNNPKQPIEDLNAFAKRAADDFMGPVLRERKRALEGYNKAKEGDAPKAPVTKKKPAAQAGGSKDKSSKKDRVASMTDLETLVQGHQGWGE